jgi:formate dehydrogenase gamma subunit
MTNPANLDTTCGSCHPGASEQFVRYPVHFDERQEASTGEVVGLWVKRIYWVLLIGVLGGMFVHNLIILAYYIRKKWREEEKDPGRRRFSRSEVLQHTLFVISFILLAFTGFMLAYPDTWWAQGMASIGFTEQYRRWVHRACAVVMVAVSLYHTWWILSSPYGRKEIVRIFPRLSDGRHVLQNMRYHLGKSEHPAAFPKFDYPAKAEYWALVWGTIVMALTGLMLWFPVVTSSFLPAWSVKVAEIIHLFEAWLATLAILIFHFFYVIFHPEVYPLSFAMLSGRMPRRQAEHHHPGWTEDQDAPEPKTAA